MQIRLKIRTLFAMCGITLVHNIIPRGRRHSVQNNLKVLYICAALCTSALVPVLADPDPLPPGDEGFQPSAVTQPFSEDKDATPAVVNPAPVAPRGPVAPAARQPAGALSGKIVYMSPGHGWTADTSPPAGVTVGTWYTQRPELHEMIEDLGNYDQNTMFADYCFNAGATVVSFRPIGFQRNQVIVDNDDPNVAYAGTWINSTSTIFFGTTGDIPYRYALTAPTETATARYSPNIPQAGFYPVYCWANDGPDRATDHLYRVSHTGGTSEVRINHRRVGKGWIYLGTYYFVAGSQPNQYVEISNQSASGTVVVADAIRFGNGMGDINRGAGISGYPREDEASRYWVQRGLATGVSASVYNGSGNDNSDNVGTPPRMAAHMNVETNGSDTDRVYIGFHSNAGGGRGVLGLYNNGTLFPGTQTPNQLRLAELLGREINDDLVAIGSPPLEFAWSNRSTVTYARSDFAFGEIRDDTINGEMDATIVEVAFHDNASDAALMRDPKVRDWVARATLQGTVRYFNQFTGSPLVFLPDPPTNVRVTSNGSGGAVVSWNAPGANSFRGGAATGYVVYRSSNGYGFGNPVFVAGGATLSTTISGIPPGQLTYFRVAATNAGGESLPSETLAFRARAAGSASVIIVNGFDRIDKLINPRETQGPGVGSSTGPSGTFDRVKPRKSNSYDYVVQHATALLTHNVFFDSASNEAISAGQVALAPYLAAVWILGEESTIDDTFDATEQSLLQTFLNTNSGRLFVSGSEIGWDLDQANNGRTFFEGTLFNNCIADDANTFQVNPAGGIFTGLAAFNFDPAQGAPYVSNYPDQIAPLGTAIGNLTYAGGTGGFAGTQVSSGNYKVVTLAFPFELITSQATRNSMMSAIMTYFGLSAVSDWSLY